MSQLTIEDAIAAGQEAMQQCADKAESLGFSTDAARDFVIGWLALSGPAWGEDMVDAAERLGRADLRTHKPKAWGGVFSALSKKGRIRCIELGLRRKGHGTAGARKWSLVQ